MAGDQFESQGSARRTDGRQLRYLGIRRTRRTMAAPGYAPDIEGRLCGQGTRPADVERELQGLRERPGEVADLQGDATDSRGAGALGMLSGNFYQTLRQTQFMHKGPLVF